MKKQTMAAEDVLEQTIFNPDFCMHHKLRLLLTLFQKLQEKKTKGKELASQAIATCTLGSIFLLCIYFFFVQLAEYGLNP